MKSLIILVFLTPFILVGQSKTAQPRDVPEGDIPLDLSISHVTTGSLFYQLADTLAYHGSLELSADNYGEAFYLRVSIIERGSGMALMLELIQAAWKEEDEQEIKNRLYYTGFELVDGLLRMSNLTDLKFVEWKDYNRFILSEGVHKFSVELIPGGNLNVRKL